MHHPDHDRSTPSADAPVSVHFVNNVLAAAAGYIEDEPDTARDVLAELGAFLTHRLRPGRTITLGEELDHVATYLRLEQARFPGRIEAELPSRDGLPRTTTTPGGLQAPCGEALSRWMGSRAGRVHAALRLREDAFELQLDAPDTPDGGGERVLIPVTGPTGATS